MAAVKDILDKLPVSAVDETAIQHGDVFDIGGSGILPAVRKHLEDVLNGECNTLDKSVFYMDDKWKAISKRSHQTKNEEKILSDKMDQVRPMLQKMKVLVELGPGTFTKTRKLLQGLDSEEKYAYIAVDFNKNSLHEHIPLLNRDFENVACAGLWGTFDQALDVLKPLSPVQVCVLSFGSTLSNGPMDEVANSMRQWSRIANMLIIGQDGSTSKDSIEALYHNNTFWNFVDVGLKNADSIVNRTIFERSISSRTCKMNENPWSHSFIITVKKDMPEPVRAAGSSVEVFRSYKYCEQDIRVIASRAGCIVTDVFEGSEETASRIYVIQPANTTAD